MAIIAYSELRSSSGSFNTVFYKVVIACRAFLSTRVREVSGRHFLPNGMYNGAVNHELPREGKLNPMKIAHSTKGKHLLIIRKVIK